MYLILANSFYSQRFYKLKREADALIAKSASSDGTAQPSTPSTNKKTAAKPKSTVKASAKSTGRGRKRKTADEDNVIDESSDNDESPSRKKVKGEPKEEVVNGEESSQEG